MPAGVNIMFKYTAAKTVLANLKKINKANKVFMHGDYSAAAAILNPYNINSYNDYIQFNRSFANVAFFSVKQQQFIPVGSSMFPASMFDVILCD
jgi:hypothetical protein